MENLKKKVYDLFVEELNDLSIGYSFNKDRIRKMIDYIAQDTCNQDYITELSE